MKPRLLLKKNVGYLVLALFFTSTIVLNFQNCSKGFEAIQNVTEDPSAASSPQISIAITEAPSLTNLNVVNIRFAVSGISNESIRSIMCQLNSDPPSDCSVKFVAYPNLADGDYSTKIVVESKSGARAEAIHVFRKDGTAPVISVSSQPSIITSKTSDSFNFMVSDNLSGVESIQCSLNNAPFSTCISPHAVENLATGPQNFRIKAVDKASNESLYTFNWAVDLTKPTVSITEKPAAVTNSADATFKFSGDGIVKFECQLNAEPYETCVSPKQYTGRLEGTHTFRVKGTSAAGVTSEAASYQWQIDLTPPTQPVLTANVSNLTALRSAIISFNSSDTTGISKYECSHNSSAFTTCSSPKEFINNLLEGNNSFRVRAFDLVGNVSPEGSFNWNVDFSPPQITLTQAPPSFHASLTSNFSFNVTDTHSSVFDVLCSLKSALTASEFTDCKDGNLSYKLSPGRYTLTIRATDLLGNAGTKTFAWEVDNGTGVIPKFKEFANNQNNLKCGITTDNRMLCFRGLAGSYIIGLEGLHNLVITTSGFCALNASKAILCWDWTNGKLNITTRPELTNVNSISSGTMFSCALLNDNTVWCWGDNSEGQLGNNSNVSSTVPVKVFGLSNAKSLHVGWRTACAITLDGKVKCWGSNSEGQLGNGSKLSSTTPVDVTGLTDVKEVQAGFWHSCALLNSGKMKCWGSGHYIGGATEYLSSSTPVDVPDLIEVQQFKVGWLGTCAILSDKSLKCWGMHQSYSIFDITSLKPTDMGGFNDIKSLDQGVGNCILHGDGSARCFGDNPSGDLGFNSTTLSLGPVPADHLSNFKSIKASNYFACGITQEDNVLCWGYNFNSQLGNGNSKASPIPVPVSNLGKVKSLTVDRWTSCALTTSDLLKCWGYNYWGELGDGTRSYRSSSVEVVNVANVKEISGTCALLLDGTVKCWGANGVSGIPYATPNPSAVTVPGLSGAKSISVSGNNACVTDSAGKVYCWGLLESGHAVSTPTEVVGISNAVAVSVGTEVRCGLTQTGGVKCWGRSHAGGLGNGVLDTDNNSTAQFFTAVGVVGLSSGVAKVVVGDQNACALKTNGQVMCWGENSRGSLGIGTIQHSSVPVLVPSTKVVEDIHISGPTLHLIHGDGSVSTSGVKHFFYNEHAGLIRIAN